MKNKYGGSVFIMKLEGGGGKEKAQSVTILRGEFVKTTTQFHCLLCAVVGDFSFLFPPYTIGYIGADFSSFFALLFISHLSFIKNNNNNKETKEQKKAKLFHVCEATSEIPLSAIPVQPDTVPSRAESRAAHKLTKHRSHSDVTFVQRRLARL